MNSCLCVANYWFPQNQQFATHSFDKEKVLDMFEQIFSARIQPVGARRSFFFLGHRALDELETWQLAQRKF